MTTELEIGAEAVTLGRSPSCAIVIDQPGVSRQHTSVRRTPGGLELTDLGSSNGTYVNGKRAQRALLSEGDLVQIGSCAMTVTRSGLQLPAQAFAKPSLGKAGSSPSRHAKPPIFWLLLALGAVAVLMLFQRGTETPEVVTDPMPRLDASAAVVAGPTDTAAPQAPTQAIGTTAARATPSTVAEALSLQALMPAPGAQQAGEVVFTWRSNAALAPSDIFDVRICAGADCVPRQGKTNTRQTTWAWCPDAGAGAYRWQVIVVDDVSKRQTGPVGPVMGFEWKGGCNIRNVAGTGQNRDKPTAAADATKAPGEATDVPVVPTTPGKGPVTPSLP